MNEDIKYYLTELGKHPNVPYYMGNTTVALELFRVVKEKYPFAKLYQDGVEIYICATDRARKALLKRYELRKRKAEEKLHNTTCMIEKLRRDECV